MTSFALEPIYESIPFAICIGILTYAVILLVTPPTQNQSQRRWLMALRVMSATVLLLALLRPALLRTDNRPADAVLVVAVDASRSMTLPDGLGGLRWDAQQQAWRELVAGVTGLESLQVRLLAYDAQARKLPAAGPDALVDLQPIGELTDLSSAALATMQAAEGQPIAGVVFMGDGAQTAESTGNGAQRVVETLNSLGVPLWTVPFGPARGETATRDAAIESLQDHYQLFTGNAVDVQFQLSTRGLTGIDVPIRLIWIDENDKQQEVATRSVTPLEATDVQPLSISVVAPSPGSYRLVVQADQQQGEVVTTNNVQTAFVDVREGGGRILYLEGALRLEQARIRQSLRRFQDLDLTYRWIPENTSAAWPIDLAESFQPGKFDIYIIGDLDARALGDSQLGELGEAVSAGAGIVLLGGNQSFGLGGYATSPLASVLPIQMDAARRRSIEQQSLDSKYQLKGPIEIRVTRPHPITQLSGDDSAEVWSGLPPMLGANQLVGAKVAPGVATLLETTQEEPLLVVGQYGRGRTAALAIDSTWRWWHSGQQDAHRRFWRQLTLWLLSREETSGDNIAIQMDARRFSASKPPAFRASVQTVGSSNAKGDLVAEIVDSAGSITPITASTVNRSEQSPASSDQRIRGDIPKLAAGFYQLRVRPAAASSTLAPTEMAFQVIEESRELANPMADPVYLRQLADLTSDHGGASFNPDEISQLVDMIKDRRQRAETPVVQKYRLGDGPISGWILFSIFTATLTTEWFFRRRWGLA